MLLYDQSLYPNGKLGWRNIMSYSLPIVLILIIPWLIPTDAGLFFAPSSSLYAGITLAILLFAWSYRDVSYRLSDPRLWAILYAVYTLLTNLWAASYTDSIELTVMEIAALALFVNLRLRDRIVARWLVLSLMISGILIYLYGLGAAVSLWQATDAVYDVNKLASIFQYHNTFASFETAVAILALLFGTMQSSRIFQAIAYLAFYFGIDSVIGSGSRSMLVFAGIAILIALIVRAVMTRAFWSTILTVLMTVFALGASTWTTQAVNVKTPSSFWFNVLVGVLVSVVIAYALPYLERVKLSKRQIKIGSLGVIVVVLAGVVLERKHLLHAFQSVLHRLSTIGLQSISLQERFYYYKDALPMWLSSPIVGSGGLAWKAKFQAFQTLPYWSEQVHSLFFEILLDGGLIGLILALVLFVFALRAVWRHYQAQQDLSGRLYVLAVTFAALVMLVHAMIDFDFSYGYILFVFAILCALAVGSTTPDSSVPVASSSSRGSVLQQKRDQTRKRLLVARSLGIALCFGVAFVLALSNGFALLSFSPSATTTYAASLNLSGLQSATTLAPYDGQLLEQLANYDWQTGSSSQSSNLVANAWPLAMAAHQASPWNPTVQIQSAIIAYQLRHYTHAIAYGQQALRDGPFNENVYVNLMGIELWSSAILDKSQKATSLARWHDVISLATKYQQQQRIINMTLFPASIAMKNDASIDVYTATANVLLHHPHQAQKALQAMVGTTPDATATGLKAVDTVLIDQELGLVPSAYASLLTSVKQNPSTSGQYQFLSGLL
nr:O-antigen ligase family protein [Bacilli bacterium]